MESIGQKRVRVLVTDDSACARLVLSRLLQADPQVDVVGTASHCFGTLEKISTLKPGVVGLDMAMPDMASQIRQLCTGHQSS